MKIAIALFSLLFRMSSFASICDMSNNRLFWASDSAIEQFKCQSDSALLCVSKSNFLGDGAEYFVIAGAFNHASENSSEVKAWGFTKNDAFSIFTEDENWLIVKDTPRINFVRNDKNKKRAFILNKKTGRATYSIDEKENEIGTHWNKILLEKFSCTKTK